MRRFGLIGFPLGHSFSKQYFTDRFEKEGRTDCRYDLFPIENIEALPELIRSTPGLEGLNVTIPYKQAVIPYLQHTGQLPATLHACNCIRIIDGECYGFNTDWVGFENSLKPLLKPHHQQALVLGNGGAALAVKYVLQRLGLPYQVVGRSIKDDINLTYRELDADIMQTHQVIINTTPLGTFPDTASCPDIPYEQLTGEHLLYDLVYNPPLTLFLQKGQEIGATIKNGYDMLVGQAEESWRIWNS
jgi:shikimate dehydrogenase